MNYDLKYGVNVRDYEHHMEKHPEESFELNSNEEEWAMTGDYEWENITEEGTTEKLHERALGEDARCALLWKKSYLAVRGTPTEFQRLQERLESLRDVERIYEENISLKEELAELSDVEEIYNENEELRAANTELQETIDTMEETHAAEIQEFRELCEAQKQAIRDKCEKWKDE